MDELEFEKIRKLTPAGEEYLCDYRCYDCFGEEQLSNSLERAMMSEYMNNYEDDLRSTKALKNHERIPVDEKNIAKIFQVSSYLEESLKEALSMYKIYSYCDELPCLSEREASMSLIFVLDDKVTVNIGNTYKYLEWDEIFDELLGYSQNHHIDSIWHKPGLRKAFFLLTDMWDARPIYKIFEETVAGAIVDVDTQELVFFDKDSAVMIYHEFFNLCEQQTTYWYGDDGHSGGHPLYDNSNIENSENPNVRRFLELLDRYKTDFKIEEQLKKWDF